MSNLPTDLEDEPIIGGTGGVRHDRSRKKMFWLLGLVALIVVLIVVIVVLIVTLRPKSNDVNAWTDAVDVENIMGHLNKLQDIAYTVGGGNRAMGTPGFNASGEYVLSQLRAAGYEPIVQYFTAPNWSVLGAQMLQTQPVQFSWNYPADFTPIVYSFGGVVAAKKLVFVGDGCSQEKYTEKGFVAGDIALVSRSANCLTANIVDNATAAGAGALLIANNNPSVAGPYRTRVDWHKYEDVKFPMVTVSTSLGSILQQLLAENQTVTLSLNVTTSLIATPTYNIIADTKDGRANRTIVVGSHLDSVPAGPGINDNGSGSSTNLELALTLAKLKIELKNRIRFAWWAAEELGLLGSTFYVNDLVANHPEELKTIAFNLNYDMLGSPNFFRGIYNGSSGPENVAVGSGLLQEMWEKYFTDKGIAYNMTEFDGRSDYGAFIANGIPAGGLFTGAEVIKSSVDAVRYGGLAGASYDPCYHLACDTVANINKQVLGEMAKSIAFNLQELATNEHLVDSIATNTKP
jgi:Zn-dependent M28 family amino/carboxypeptidase